MTIVTIIFICLVNACSDFPTWVEPTDCQDIRTRGFHDSGVYHVTPPGTFYGVDVYCDLEIAGGGGL